VPMNRHPVPIAQVSPFSAVASVTLAIVLAAGARAAEPAAAAPGGGQIDFARDVQPILAENCYHCHGPDAAERKADLRLDKEKEAKADLGSGTFAIVPGKGGESELIRRMLSADPDEKMPPPNSHREVTPAQIETLRQWIDQGAVWGDHWSFVAPKRPELPKVNTAGWVKNPIDAFILARLEKEGLAPSPETSKEKLIRRVTLDLTGLPPTPAEIDAFVADQSADAYDKLVDRLLASPKYGERMVVDWLDAARYADTNGYQADPTRTNWPWRDWAVEAMNANLPYDRFVTEQLAGDLLPSATLKQRIATAFNRNHTYNGEGGRIADETRTENVFDRTETVGTVFMGLTIGCTRCHDHKFDPVTQAEYYQLYAFFNNCSETGQLSYVGGGNAPPVVAYASPEQEQQLAALRAKVGEAEAKLTAGIAQVDAEQAEWEKTTAAAIAAAGPPGWAVVAPTSTASLSTGTTFTKLDDGSVLVGGESPEKDVHTVVLHTDKSGLTGLKLEALPHESLPHNGPGRSTDTGNFVLSHLEVEAANRSNTTETKKVALASATATYEQGDLKASTTIDPDTEKGWAVWNAPDKNNISATFVFAEPAGFASGTELRLRFKYESGHVRHTMGRFRVSLTSGPGVTLPADVVAALAVAPDQRNDQHKQQIRDHYRKAVSPTFASLNGPVEAARKTVTDFDNGLVKVMVMDDATPRETRILTVGAYDKPKGDKLDAGTPAVLNPWPDGAPRNRLGLARWLTDPANPLLARVTVNRYWQMFFGTGLVKTSDDFGLQGEMPSHPELLDWLAVEFREPSVPGASHAWDVKAIHRLIVTSNAYRQGSKASPELMERDPANRLLARGPRYRLSSFMIRDQALAASGLLVDKVGGAPVKPYQPPGVWEEMSLDQIKYEPDKGEALYRRSLYTFWRRTVAPTTFFDVPQRTVCSVRTVRTNTPLHALALLNDVTYVEAARVLSEKLLLDKGMTDDAARLEQVFRLATARKPVESERQVLAGALARLRGQYAADPDAAAKLVKVGEKARDASLDAKELAAWTAVVSMVMNLDEAITQE
jgi:hypothetical protein